MRISLQVRRRAIGAPTRMLPTPLRLVQRQRLVMSILLPTMGANVSPNLLVAAQDASPAMTGLLQPGYSLGVAKAQRDG